MRKNLRSRGFELVHSVEERKIISLTPAGKFLQIPVTR